MKDKIIIKNRKNSETGLIQLPLNDDGSVNSSELPPYPPILFRYRGNNIEHITDEISNLCCNRTIFTSRFSSFPDERELRPQIIPASAGEFRWIIERCFELDADWVFPSYHLRDVAEGFGIPYFKMRRILKSDNFSNHIKSCRMWAERDIGNLREKLRCACFSKTPKSGMMWERYSTYGTGVCFKLVYNEARARDLTSKTLGKSNKLSFGEVTLMPKGYCHTSPSFIAAKLSYLTHSDFADITYTDVLPKVTDLDICIGNIQHEDKYIGECVRVYIEKDYLKKLIYTKSDDYNGEREWRYIYKRSDLYAPFPAYDLDLVIFGVNVDSKLKNAVTDICNKYSVGCANAVPSRSDFGMDIDNI